MRRRAAVTASALLLVGLPAPAASFDAQGRLLPDPAAAVAQGFESESATELGIHCENSCSWSSADAAKELPLEGKRYLRIDSGQDPFEIDFAPPAENAAYVFRVWVRHARVAARVVFQHSEGAGRPTESGFLFPTGRVTSDGWVELASNPISVSGSLIGRAFLRVDGSGVDLDAFEAVREGSYDGGSTCLGAFDPVCGDEAICVGERCRQGARFVPPLPASEHQQAVARYLASRVRYFFGGQLSRKKNLPKALAALDAMLAAKTPWQYWSAFARGVRLLGDWHTGAGSAIESQGSGRRLGLCFIEGQADLSQATWPSQAGRLDLLVSHVGPAGTLGLLPGDRLVAVDGMHPIDWARSLLDVDWRFHVATDPDVDADLAEAMRDLIPRFAKSFSVIRCDKATHTCSTTIETLAVTEIENDVQPPACDNRPSYHLENPPEQTPGVITDYHYVPFFPWRDRVVDSQPGEEIYGMTFDYLYGGAQGLTSYFLQSNDFFKEKARGVILDHRAGNGGTLDAPQAITRLVRKPVLVSIGPTFMATAAYDGPESPEEALQLVEQLKNAGNLSYTPGSDSADESLPVALLIHRDASASDWLPHGMKGAAKVRIFGPHETGGAFSSFYQFAYWSRLDFQLASGDTYLIDGTPLIGRGIEPDEIVHHTQTSLLEGHDAPYDAALAWVRKNLK